MIRFKRCMVGGYPARSVELLYIRGSVEDACYLGTIRECDLRSDGPCAQFYAGAQQRMESARVDPFTRHFALDDLAAHIKRPQEKSTSTTVRVDVLGVTEAGSAEAEAGAPKPAAPKEVTREAAKEAKEVERSKRDVGQTDRRLLRGEMSLTEFETRISDVDGYALVRTSHGHRQYKNGYGQHLTLAHHGVAKKIDRETIDHKDHEIRHNQALRIQTPQTMTPPSTLKGAQIKAMSIAGTAGTVGDKNEKECKRCHRPLPLSAFKSHPWTADHLQNWCTDCYREAATNRHHSGASTLKEQARAVWHPGMTLRQLAKAISVSRTTAWKFSVEFRAELAELAARQTAKALEKALETETTTAALHVVHVEEPAASVVAVPLIPATLTPSTAEEIAEAIEATRVTPITIPAPADPVAPAPAASAPAHASFTLAEWLALHECPSVFITDTAEVFLMTERLDAVEDACEPECRVLTTDGSLPYVTFSTSQMGLVAQLLLKKKPSEITGRVAYCAKEAA